VNTKIASTQHSHGTTFVATKARMRSKMKVHATPQQFLAEVNRIEEYLVFLEEGALKKTAASSTVTIPNVLPFGFEKAPSALDILNQAEVQAEGKAREILRPLIERAEVAPEGDELIQLPTLDELLHATWTFGNYTRFMEHDKQAPDFGGGPEDDEGEASPPINSGPPSPSSPGVGGPPNDQKPRPAKKKRRRRHRRRSRDDEESEEQDAPPPTTPCPPPPAPPPPPTAQQAPLPPPPQFPSTTGFLPPNTPVVYVPYQVPAGHPGFPPNMPLAHAIPGMAPGMMPMIPGGQIVVPNAPLAPMPTIAAPPMVQAAPMVTAPAAPIYSAPVTPQTAPIVVTPAGVPVGGVYVQNKKDEVKILPKTGLVQKSSTEVHVEPVQTPPIVKKAPITPKEKATVASQTPSKPVAAPVVAVQAEVQTSPPPPPLEDNQFGPDPNATVDTSEREKKGALLAAKKAVVEKPVAKKAIIESEDSDSEPPVKEVQAAVKPHEPQTQNEKMQELLKLKQSLLQSHKRSKRKGHVHKKGKKHKGKGNDMDAFIANLYDDSGNLPVQYQTWKPGKNDKVQAQPLSPTMEAMKKALGDDESEAVAKGASFLEIAGKITIRIGDYHRSAAVALLNAYGTALHSPGLLKLANRFRHPLSGTLIQHLRHISYMHLPTPQQTKSLPIPNITPPGTNAATQAEMKQHITQANQLCEQFRTQEVPSVTMLRKALVDAHDTIINEQAELAAYLRMRDYTIQLPAYNDEALRWREQTLEWIQGKQAEATERLVSSTQKFSTVQSQAAPVRDQLARIQTQCGMTDPEINRQRERLELRAMKEALELLGDSTK